jgi:hypothetical protein
MALLEFKRHLSEKSFIDFKSIEWKEEEAESKLVVERTGELIAESGEHVSLSMSLFGTSEEWEISSIQGEKDGAKFYFTFYENELKALRYFELIEAVKNRTHSETLKLLAAGVHPSGGDFLGRPNTGSQAEYFASLTDTPLHYAVAQGDYKTAQLLIEHGAHPNFCCCSCVTPLHRAILTGHPELVKLLLENGGDPSVGYSEMDEPIPDCFWLAKKIGNAAVREVLEKFRKTDVISPKYQKYHVGYGAITFDKIVNDTVAGKIDHYFE